MTPTEKLALRRLIEGIAHLCQSALEMLEEKKPEPEEPARPRGPRFMGDDDARQG